MPHDGGTMPGSLLSPDLLALAGTAAETVARLRDDGITALRAHVTEDGKVSAALIDRHQFAAHSLSWLATYAESLIQLHAWAARLSEQGRLGETEALILQIGFGEYLAQM